MLQFLYFFALLPVISERAFAALGPVTDLPIAISEISPDGFLRSAVLVDGVFPGPLIKANKRDDFAINVFNQLTDNSMDLVTSIHWHGIFQRTTNYADGSPFVTQCPIVPNESFLYKFNGEGQTGTYWYHSHLQAQYCDGLRGPLVIYDPNDPHAGLYDVDDDDTVITLADWYHFVSTQAPLVPEPNSTLINGQGRYPGGPPVPLAVVNVASGLRYRLRLVSISCDPNFTFSIDGHQLTIIEVDGDNVQPLVVDSLQIFAGKRNLKADRVVDNYWIRALPNLSDGDYADFTNVAILRYLEAPIEDPLSDPNVNVPTSLVPLVETNLHPLEPTPVPGEPFPGGADININLAVTLGSDYTEFLVNGFPFDSPTVPVLLQILSGAQSAADLVPTGSIYKLEPNKSVEISLPAGVADGPHPIHLHGHAFHVVRSAGSSVYNFDDPVIRDVVSMGKTGDNVTIRFFTDNPGPWILNCHVNWHSTKGFAVVFAEDVPEVSTTDVVPDSWRSLCPAYDNFESRT
ncbi:laccase [Multifurca ochricompacta]|uniref:laccase n=1 Tax=Multifurca ochricompacta TaxID=376703 RepID=A0AAD4LT56_9AGAM|nr:laccase [Multifurca ochricompacta]